MDGVPDGVGVGVVVSGVRGFGPGALDGLGRRAAAFFAALLGAALRVLFLAAAFLPFLPFAPEAFRAAFLWLEALRFAFFLATAVPP